MPVLVPRCEWIMEKKNCIFSINCKSSPQITTPGNSLEANSLADVKLFCYHVWQDSFAGLSCFFTPCIASWLETFFSHRKKTSLLRSWKKLRGEQGSGGKFVAAGNGFLRTHFRFCLFPEGREGWETTSHDPVIHITGDIQECSIISGFIRRSYPLCHNSSLWHLCPRRITRFGWLTCCELRAHSVIRAPLEE